ncbi:MAG TPA: cold shock domain-containing protein [Xanthobacteraceae bacterium]|jgi:cold shock CspA family protein
MAIQRVPRQRGTVKWFSPERGYGFIRHDDGEIFVHITAVAAERILNDGDPVSFVFDSRDGRPCATSVVLESEAP